MQLFRKIETAMENRRRRQNRQALVVFSALMIFFCAFAAMVSIIGMVQNRIESANVTRLYGDTIAAACQPMPVGEVARANRPGSASPQQIVLLQSDSQLRHKWHDQLPEQWRASNADEVDLVTCIEDEEILVESCDYQRASRAAEDGGTFTITVERYQQQTTLTLINPDTARIIDTLSLAGSEPAPCPVDDGEFMSRKFAGEDTQWSEASSWLESYIFADSD